MNINEIELDDTEPSLDEIKKLADNKDLINVKLIREKIELKI